MQLSNDLINPKLITHYPNMSDTARNWIARISECEWVEDYFNFLNRQLLSLKGSQRNEILTRIVSPNDTQYHEAIAELIYVAFWNHLKWPFEKDPKINGKTPDFKVNFDKKCNQSFLSEVTVVRHKHPRSNIVFDVQSGSIKSIKIDGKIIDKNTQGLPPETTPIEQAHRFLMKIKEKFDKYSEILHNNLFIICFFIHNRMDDFYLDDFQINNALFGDLVVNFDNGERWHQPSIQTTQHNQEVERGIFPFEKYKLLTAVIICSQSFYSTSKTKLKVPRPHYPQKAKFGFSIYANPLGKWANKEKNPFSLSGLPVNGVIDIDKLKFCDPKEMEFY